MEDRDLVETMTAAFLEDPLYRWLYPDESTRPDALRDNLRLSIALVRERGHVATTSAGDGIALWTDPGVELLDDPAPFVELLERWAPDRLEPALAGMAACNVHRHPSDAVLHVLAVHPARQGRGIAAGLLAPILQELDREGSSTYLESSNPRNLSFYRRCGFHTLGEIAVSAGGPRMRPMRRCASDG